MATPPPTSSAPWSFQESDNTITVALGGDFDEAVARSLDAALRERMTRTTPGTYSVVFDLNGLRRCSVEGRAILAELQRHLGGIARRTAYVTNRPLFRGVALWICHSAPDANARTFPSTGHANAWLESSDNRGDVLEQGAVQWVARAKTLTFAKEATP
ncbi:MAG: STAS domain-containing protein [Nannocystaceae bacterium]